MQNLLEIGGLEKHFILHIQEGQRIDVFKDFALTLGRGEALGLAGASGKGKSSLLKLIWGSYKPSSGQVLVRHKDITIDMARASPREIIDVRRHTVGYVTQFLRVIPRVTALDVVSEPLLERGVPLTKARERAAILLSRLRIPEKLWKLPPLTFSGGEQQRVNIARGFAAPSPILLLDEPTASLDSINRARVLELVREALAQGSAVIGIFHDETERDAISTRTLSL